MLFVLLPNSRTWPFTFNHALCNDNTQLQRATQIHLEVFGGIWYSLYNAQILGLCEIAEAWHCSLRSVAQSWREIRLISSSLTECFLSMQVCLSKHIKEMSEIELCVTRAIRLTKKWQTLALGLLSTLFRSFKADLTLQTKQILLTHWSEAIKCLKEEITHFFSGKNWIHKL